MIEPYDFCLCEPLFVLPFIWEIENKRKVAYKNLPICYNWYFTSLVINV